MFSTPAVRVQTVPRPRPSRRAADRTGRAPRPRPDPGGRRYPEVRACLRTRRGVSSVTRDPSRRWAEGSDGDRWRTGPHPRGWLAERGPLTGVSGHPVGDHIGPAPPRGGRAGRRNPADGRPGIPGRAELGDHHDLLGLRAPVALRDLELDPLPLLEGAVAIRLDRREMDEDVPATVDGDEAVPLVRVEPLDGALSHSKQLPNCARASSSALHPRNPSIANRRERLRARTHEPRPNPERRPEPTLPPTGLPRRHLPVNHPASAARGGRRRRRPPRGSPRPAPPPAPACRGHARSARPPRPRRR